MKSQAVAAEFEARISGVIATDRELRSGLPRGFDMLMAAVLLIIAAPLLFALGLLVALTSPGGVLFRQQRVGKNGRLFTLHKFRTMRVRNDGPEVTRAGDSRITRVGKLLRQTKLDELPTLWNVMKGDMALVGPRPEVPRYVRLEDPRWQLVLRAKPGITDPTTMSLRNEEVLLAEVKGDVEAYYLNELQSLKLKGYLDYLDSRTWRSDLNILLQTVWAVIIPQRFK